MSKEIMIFDRWADLHSDLLHEIVKHLHFSKDYVRLRAICKSWNLNLPKTPNHIRGPQLVLPFNADTFYIEEKDFYLRLPGMRNTLLRGSGFGWLISIDIEGVLRMLNPFTKAQLDLPPMSTIPDIVEYLPNMIDYAYIIRDFANNGDNDEIYALEKSHVQKMHLKKIIISSSPDKQDFMAITIYGEYDRLAFCRLADNKWTDFSTLDIIKCGLDDVIFYEGKVYAIDWRARLFEFDMKTSIGGISEVAKSDELDIPLACDRNTKYLVRNVEGSLLMVVRHFKYHQVGNGDDQVSCFNTFKFDIYKLDTSAKRWKRMFSLENYVLVVGFNSSICMLPFSDGKGNWIKNCIYFTDDNVESQCSEIVGGHDAGVFNLEDGRVDKLFPNLEFLYPPPIWLISQNFIC